MSFKALVVGDIHAKADNAADIRLLVENLKAIFLQEKPNIFVLLGDLANDFEKMHIIAWQSICYLMDELRMLAPVFYVVGNHDYINNSEFLTENHFFNSFKNWREYAEGVHDIHVIDKPQVFQFSFETKNSLVFCPYVFPGRFQEALNTLDYEHVKKTAKAIFCHQEFKGSQMGAITSRAGDEWPIDGLPVFSGHIHDRQRLQDNITYIGTPRYTSHGDTGEKTVSLIEFTEDSVIETVIPTKMPKKVTVITKACDFEDLTLDPNSDSRVVIIGTQEEILKLKNSTKYKELSKTTKIILKPADKVVVVKRGETDYSYLSILKTAVAAESPIVQQVFEEICRNVLKA